MIINPFSSRFVSPGTCEFVDRSLLEHANQSLGTASEKFLTLDCCAQIVGPHGCGKSTFAIQLAKKLKSENKIDRFISVAIRSNLRNQDKPLALPTSEDNENRTLLILDGIESLSWIHRHSLLQYLTRHYFATLITGHRPVRRLPILDKFAPDPTHFRNIVDGLQSASECKLTPTEIESCYQLHSYNYRNALFALYDLWEAKTAAQSDDKVETSYGSSQPSNVAI